MPLVIRFVSTDTFKLKVDSVGTVAAGTYYTNPNPAVTAIAPGTAKIIASAPGHLPDTNSWTVQPAALSLSWYSYVIGARQTRQATDFYVQIPQSRGTPVTVTLTQKQATKVALSATSVTIAGNNDYQSFTFAGLATGTDTIIATAPGYLPDTGFVTVTTPQLRASSLPSTATTTSPPQTVTVYTADSTNTVQYASDTVVVRAVSSNANVIIPGEAYFRIPKGSYYFNPTVVYKGVGTASITYSDSAGTGYLPATTNTVTVTGPSLLFSNPSGVLGMRQQTGDRKSVV